MINKLTGEPVSAEMQSVLKRLAASESVPEAEIMALKEIKEANSCISSSKPTIELKDRAGIQEGVFDRLQNMGSAVTKSDGAVSFSGEIRCERRMDIVIGLPASGKSSALVEPISEMYKSRVIDSDEAKKLLPEYNDGWGAGIVHKESQRISEQQLIAALEKGENITYPRVGGDATELINIAAIAKSKGYSVYVHFNELDRNKALGRMINRFLETGRYIKPELITRYGNDINNTYEQAKKATSIVDGFSKWSNDVPLGSRPKLIEYSSSCEDIVSCSERVWRRQRNSRKPVYNQLLRPTAALSEQKAKGYFIQTADIAFPRNTERTSINTKKISRGFENKAYDYFVYDGQGYSIKNMSSNGGLFGSIAASTIKNVVIDGANIKAGNNKNVGVICNEVISYAYPANEGDEFFSTGNSRFIGCKVLNCKITADGADNVGGICGFGGAVSDCMASGITFSGGDNIGGIVGNACSVTGCLANNITANGYVKSAGGIAGTAYGVKLYNDGDKARYSGGNIIGCGVRTFTSTADNSGGIVGTATADNSSAYIKSCYVANIYLNGKNNGGIAGADGNKTGHKITYCLVDNSNKYPVIGGSKLRSTAKVMILSVPADTGLTVEGVLSVLNANASGYSYWERSDSINGGYPYPKKIDFESLTAERK